MATGNEHVLVAHPGDKLVTLAEISAAADSQPAGAVTFRLLVEQDYCGDVDEMEDVAIRVPLRDLARQGAVDRAFGDLVARLDHPTLRPEVAAAAREAEAAARVQARCDAAADGELGGVEFRLRVVFHDTSEEWASDDDECGSDMEFGEFDVSGARSLQDQQAVAGYGDDDDGYGCGAQFTVRPYRGGVDANLQLSDFQARSDGPELTDQHELTSYDMRHLVHLALEGGGSMEDDEAYQRALSGGAPMSRVSRAEIGRAHV